MSVAESFKQIVEKEIELDYLHNLIAEIGGLSLSEITEVQNYGKVKMRSLRDVAESLAGASDDEAQFDLGLLWIELRSEWIRFNTVINYKVVETGENDPVSEILGTYSSHIIEKIEPLLTEQKYNQVNNIIVESQAPLA